MDDPTEGVRRAASAIINADSSPREELEKKYGQCWDTEEMQRDFDVLGFAAPFVVVRRKADGKEGSLMFRHSPRIYFSFEPDKE